MLRRDFAYDLPEDLIAQHPPQQRGQSRLLCLDGVTGQTEDRSIADLPALLRPGDLLVFNNTRVLKARLLGTKATGGRVEVLAERILGEQRLLAQVRASKTPRPGMRLHVGRSLEFEVQGRRGEFYELALVSGGTVLEALEREGQLPLPPYIARAPEAGDAARYQTVFAQVPGAVAAPTAGLHFTETLLAQLRERAVESAFVTLHVGAGTFQPMRSDRLEDHVMHSEWAEVSPATSAALRDARARGGRVIAVGTTVVRTLESAARSTGQGPPWAGETNIFIYPSYRFSAVDGLITNFHLPESTLLMLVCAFGGYDHVMAAYRHAVQARYRFFSYGDAMLVWPAPGVKQ